MNIEASYLLDVGRLLKEMARETKQRALVAPADDRAFALGQLMAMHEVISLMQEQAELFGLTPEALGLDDIVPERDLV